MNNEISLLTKRFWCILACMLIVVSILIGRMIFLTFYDRAFLLNQGNARSIRIINIPAYRGMILDRNGNPLAISTPVDSIWANPQDFHFTYNNIKNLSMYLHVSPKYIRNIFKKNAQREFVYIKRGVNPDIAKSLLALAIPGIYLEREYKRYYPEGEVSSHIVGFTNIDDIGQEGLELAYNSWLSGKPGKERALKDLYGNIVAVLQDLKPAKSGHDLTLSINNQIQYLAYSVLKASVEKSHAKSGSVVVLNPKTGEILAMTNQPAFNPNNRPTHDDGQFRNRAVTDMFEPGSTMKAFSITSALDSGKYTPNTMIDTNPGRLKIGHNIVHDDDWKNHGNISVMQVLQKSSNIGVAKMTLSLPPEHFIDLLQRVGFGERTVSNFPGESPGSLTYHENWQPFVLATLAFGYGISVTPLQLAQAYGIIANHGLKCPVTLLKRENPVQCNSVIDSKIAQQMLTMLHEVVQTDGTGFRAKISGYEVAGKTGTANIAGKHGYNKHKRHIASFVGIAPLNDPQLVVAVVIKEPSNEHSQYYGGVIAAPAFAQIMKGALRILDVPPQLDNKHYANIEKTTQLSNQH